MIQRTLADVLPTLRRVASQSGLRADDARLIEIINDAQERLLSEVDNAIGTLHRVKFCQYDKLVALPSMYERIVKASVDRVGAEVMDKWYEFMDYGPGHLDNGGTVNVLIDRGEAPVIVQSTTSPAFVRCYGYQDERVNAVAPTIRILGYDESGVWVRSESGGVWSDGITLSINGHSATNYTVSSVKFSKITQVIKPKTHGVVELFWYDEAYSRLDLAARYEHWETNPSFRIYFASGILSDDTSLVHALCKVRFRPLVDVTDRLIISSIPALKKAMRAIAQEDADKVQEAEMNWSLAASILRKEAKAYYGTPRPAMDVSASGAMHGSIAHVI